MESLGEICVREVVIAAGGQEPTAHVAAFEELALCSLGCLEEGPESITSREFELLAELPSIVVGFVVREEIEPPDPLLQEFEEEEEVEEEELPIDNSNTSMDSSSQGR